MTEPAAITEVQPWMRPFPALEDVFEKVTKDIRELYLPIISIDASAVDPCWSGPLHFVMPVVPCEGGLGEYSSEAYENHFCRHNLIGFRRAKSGRYEPLADPLFFAINCARKNRGAFLRGQVNARTEMHYLKEFYAQVHASFEEARDRFKETGKLLDIMGEPDAWFLDLGGDASPHALQEFQPNQEGLSPDGRAFRYVGRLNAHPFRDSAPDGYFMFYDPVDEIVWFSLAFQ
jgi:hypothetical protein